MTKKKDYNKLPTYEIVIDPNDEISGVQMISLLSDPAIEVKGHYFNTDKKQELKKPRDWSKWKGIVTPPCHFADPPYNTIPNCSCDIVYNPAIGDHEWVLGDATCKFCLENKARWDKVNTRLSKQDIEEPRLMQFKVVKEEKCIIAPILIPYKKIYRRDDDGTEYNIVFTPEAIKMIAEKFNRGNNNTSFNVDHSNRRAPVFMRENWLVEDSVYDKSKLHGYDLSPGAWVGLLKVEDDNFWKVDIKEQEKYSFSIEGILGQKLIEFALIKVDDEPTDEQLLELEQLQVELEITLLELELQKQTK